MREQIIPSGKHCLAARKFFSPARRQLLGHRFAFAGTSGRGHKHWTAWRAAPRFYRVRGIGRVACPGISLAPFGEGGRIYGDCVQVASINGEGVTNREEEA